MEILIDLTRAFNTQTLHVWHSCLHSPQVNHPNWSVIIRNTWTASARTRGSHVVLSLDVLRSHGESHVCVGGGRVSHIRYVKQTTLWTMKHKGFFSDVQWWVCQALLSVRKKANSLFQQRLHHMKSSTHVSCSVVRSVTESMRSIGTSWVCTTGRPING